MAKKGWNIDAKTIVIIGAAIFILLMAMGYVSLNKNGLSINPSGSPTPVPNGVPGNSNGVFSGPLTINIGFINHPNLDAAYTTANGTGKVYHADGTLFGTMTSAGVVSGNVVTADHGQLYLQWQPASTVYIDVPTTVAQNAALSQPSPKVISGVEYYYFPVNVANLAQVQGITTSLNLNLFLTVADVSGLGYTSVVNATAAGYSGATWTTASCSGYISGCTQTDGFKIAKVEMSMPDAANITMFDSSEIKQLSVQLGTGSGQIWTLSQFTHSTGGSYIQFVTGNSDTTQEYNGVPVVYGTNDAATTISYSVNCQVANFAGSAAWVPTLVITYIGPDGTMGTISRPMSWTDT